MVLGGPVCQRLNQTRPTSFRTRIWSAAVRYCSWCVTRIRGLFFSTPQIHLIDEGRVTTILFVYYIYTVLSFPLCSIRHSNLRISFSEPSYSLFYLLCCPRGRVRQEELREKLLSVCHKQHRTFSWQCKPGLESLGYITQQCQHFHHFHHSCSRNFLLLWFYGEALKPSISRVLTTLVFSCLDHCSGFTKACSRRDNGTSPFCTKGTKKKNKKQLRESWCCWSLSRRQRYKTSESSSSSKKQPSLNPTESGEQKRLSWGDMEQPFTCSLTDFTQEDNNTYCSKRCLPTSASTALKGSSMR